MHEPATKEHSDFKFVRFRTQGKDDLSTETQAAAASGCVSRLQQPSDARSEPGPGPGRCAMRPPGGCNNSANA